MTNSLGGIYNFLNVSYKLLNDSSRFPGKPVGDTILFFGCRHKTEDYIYQEEIEQYHAEGTISHLFVAFSRDQVYSVLVFSSVRFDYKSGIMILWDFIR